MVLRGSHVRLEPLSLEHLPGLCAVGLDERLWRLTASQIRTPEQLRAYVDQRCASRLPMLPFATVDQKTGVVIGSTRFGATLTSPIGGSRSAGPGSVQTGNAPPRTPRPSC